MNKFIYIFLTVVFAGLVLTGCKTKKLTASFSDLDGNWNIVEMNGKTLDPVKTKQAITFDSERQTVSGNAGCNRMSGKMEYSAGQKGIIKFPRLVTTRMACMDMSLEDELLKTLDKVVRFEAATDTKPIEAIAFYGIDNTKLLVIKKQK